MKKNYFIPATISLTVNAQNVLCASGEPSSTPGRGASISTMNNGGTIIFGE